MPSFSRKGLHKRIYCFILAFALLLCDIPMVAYAQEMSTSEIMENEGTGLISLDEIENSEQNAIVEDVENDIIAEEDDYDEINKEDNQILEDDAFKDEEIFKEADVPKDEDSFVEDDMPKDKEGLIEDGVLEKENVSIEESVETEEETLIDDLEVQTELQNIALLSESEDENNIGYGLSYTINKGTLTISGNGQMRDWLDGYYADVKAPWHYEDVTNVIINAGVQTIGDNAFENCSSIKSIVCKGDISKIGLGAFTGCTSLEKLEFDGTVKFKALTSIGDCTELNTLILKKAATFEDKAIKELPKLKTLTFPEGSTFGEECFSDCLELTSVSFMGSVDLSAGKCFAFCPNLKTVAFNGTGNTRNKITNNAFYYSNKIAVITFKNAAEIGAAIFSNLPALKTLTFPAGTTFGAGAFGGCAGITSITFMGNVDLSKGYCFAGCSALKTLNLNGKGPEKSKISNNAFSGCIDIATINFKGPVDIGEAEFQYTKGIKSLTFGGDSNIEIAAFYACPNLTSVTFNGDAKLSSMAFYECTNLSKVQFKKAAELDTAYEDDIKLSPFQDCIKLASVTFGTGKTILGESALRRFSALKSVTFNGETYISAGALSDCKSLTGVTFNGYADLDAECFLECDNAKLTKLTFKKGAVFKTDAEGKYAFKDSPITTISFSDYSILNEGAFKNCDSLKTVTFSGDVELGESALSECDSLTTVKCAGTTTLESDALSGCSNLKTISFSGEVETYDSGVCSNLQSLSTVSFGNNTTLAANSFLNCPKIRKLEFKKQAKISTDSSNNYAFKDSPLESITFGGNAFLGDKAFYACNTLTSVKFKAASDLGKDVLSDCQKLKSISFGGKLSPLNNRADVTGFCSNLPALTTVTFSGDTELPYGSFNNCNNSKLNKLTFGKSVTINTNSSEGIKHAFRDSAINTITFSGPAILKYGAFQNNNSIKTITFNGNASLGEKVFSGCEALTSVAFKGNKSNRYNLGIDALRECKKLKSISFGSGALSVSGGACSQLPALTSITFGGNTTLLGECFNECTNAKLTKLAFKGDASFRPTSQKYPFVDSPISTLSIAGNADLRKDSFNDSYLKTVSLGATGKTVKITAALLRCGLLTTVKMTGTITVTDSLNVCPELTTVTIKYDVKKGESCSFNGEYFKYGLPKKIVVNGKTVQYSDL